MVSGWRNGSTLKSSYCSCRGTSSVPVTNFKHLTTSCNSIFFFLQRDPKASSGLCSHLCTYGIPTLQPAQTNAHKFIFKKLSTTLLLFLLQSQNRENRTVLKKLRIGAGGMPQWLKVLTALAEDPDSIPNVYREAHKLLQLRFQEI